MPRALRRLRARHAGRARRPRATTGAFCSVAVDDVLGGQLAVEHLLEHRATADRLRRRPVQDPPGRRPARRAPAGRRRAARARRSRPSRPHALTRARGPTPPARRLAGLRGGRAPGRGVLRQRPDRPGGAAGAEHAWRDSGPERHRDRRLRRHRVRRRRQSCRCHRCGSRAQLIGATAVQILLEEADDPHLSRATWCSSPSSSCGRRRRPRRQGSDAAPTMARRVREPPALPAASRGAARARRAVATPSSFMVRTTCSERISIVRSTPARPPAMSP